MEAEKVFFLFSYKEFAENIFLYVRVQTCDGVEEHEILKIGNLTALPFLRHVGGAHELPRRHHRSPSEK